VLLTVVALMVVMLAMSAAPAFAAWNSSGCRGTDHPVPASDSPGVDGKRTDDGAICEHVRFNRNHGIVLTYYDNRIPIDSE
jgi:hypothetical protein